MNDRIVIIGLGNIGSQLTGYLAALLFAPRSAWELVLVDHDQYQAANLGVQLMSSEDVGMNKAAAQARRLRKLHPGLSVTAHECRLQALPLGEFHAAAVVTCLDSLADRLSVCERVSRMGTLWIDTGVSADDRLARVSVFRPGPENPCMACALSDADLAGMEERHLCMGASVPRATGAPAALGALAASLAALECEKVLGGNGDQVAAGKEIVVSGKWHTHFVTTLRRNTACSFGHRKLALECTGSIAPETCTLGEFWSRFAPADPVAMEAPCGAWLTRLLCRSCGALHSTLQLRGRGAAEPERCGDCGGELAPSGFHIREALERSEISEAQLALPLSAIGVRAREVIAFRAPGRATRNLLLS